MTTGLYYTSYVRAVPANDGNYKTAFDVKRDWLDGKYLKMEHDGACFSIREVEQLKSALIDTVCVRVADMSEYYRIRI